MTTERFPRTNRYDATRSADTVQGPYRQRPTWALRWVGWTVVVTFVMFALNVALAVLAA